MKKQNARVGKIRATGVVGLSQAPTPKEKDKKKDNRLDWVYYYAGNTFPNDLALRTLRSGTHQGIVNSKHTLTVGEGLTFLQGEREVTDSYLEEINANDESFEEIADQIAYDYIFQANAYVEGVRVGDRINYFRKDPVTIRSGKMINGMIENYYYSEDWQTIKENRPASDEKVEPIPNFDPKIKQKRFILHLKNHFPGLRYYGVPDYLASILSGWIDINYRIGKHNIDKFDNGFMPSGLIQFFGGLPEGQDPTDYINEIKAKFTGEGMNNKLLVQLLDDPELSANIQLFEQLRDGDFQILDKMADQQIITSHGWFRSLCGLAEPGQLGNTQQIRNEYELAMNMKVKPAYRKPLKRFFKKMLRIAGKDYDVNFINLDPISLSGDINKNSILTRNEGREVLGYEALEGERGEEIIEVKTQSDD